MVSTSPAILLWQLGNRWPSFCFFNVIVKIPYKDRILQIFLWLQHMYLNSQHGRPRIGTGLVATSLGICQWCFLAECIGNLTFLFFQCYGDTFPLNHQKITIKSHQIPSNPIKPPWNHHQITIKSLSNPMKLFRAGLDRRPHQAQLDPFGLVPRALKKAEGPRAEWKYRGS